MSIICGIGLIPFLLYFYCISSINSNSFHLMIPLYVGINGILYHILLKRSFEAFLVDIISNIIFIFFINLTTKNQPETSITTILIIAIFIINKVYKNNEYSKIQEFIHVIFVQWGLLYLYIKSKDYKNKITESYQKKLKKIQIYKLFTSDIFIFIFISLIMLFCISYK
jgi:hypothetical protein